MSQAKRRNSTATLDLNAPINDLKPLRIAFLGEARVGKTSIIANLTLKTFNETYYPTHKINTMMFNYVPNSFISRVLLDEVESKNAFQYIAKQNDIILSPVIYGAYTKLVNASKPTEVLNALIKSKNDYFIAYNYLNEAGQKYVPPHVSPILVELIDTPGFNPDQVVPFLEASLYINLDKDILKNLANEPRKSVSTNPLLVASGASELNGNVDGYYLVYSSIPSTHPPLYDDVVNENLSNSKNGSSTKPLVMSCVDMLKVIKGALDEAWKEYYTFKTRWDQGKEQDIFSLSSALKNMWTLKNLSEVEEMRQNLRKQITLIDNSTDPADPNCPPPVCIICTHANSPLKSPMLVDEGRKLAKSWSCGFVEIDNVNDDIDKVLAIMIREVLERKKLKKKK
ncbi:uncharacterized protein PRCAT00006238001 [Priceomyces carsonii]|uniref:uncharacterized protein n=1 Tax=Priceomyces carsonii TaxID=28549 RepID=UPI002EDA8EAF|nr:unnamed protein product [Priceomyces carsonii]